MYQIIKYKPEYEDKLMEMIKQEGDDWKIYWEEPNASKYRRSFEKSITYLAIQDGKVCGYSRSLQDTLFIYVCDLLVNEQHRGHGLGLRLMKCLQEDYPELPVYIMSGNDEYYNKINCNKEGSIYLLAK